DLLRVLLGRRAFDRRDRDVGAAAASTTPAASATTAAAAGIAAVPTGAGLGEEDVDGRAHLGGLAGLGDLGRDLLRRVERLRRRLPEREVRLLQRLLGLN